MSHKQEEEEEEEEEAGNSSQRGGGNATGPDQSLLRLFILVNTASGIRPNFFFFFPTTHTQKKSILNNSGVYQHKSDLSVTGATRASVSLGMFPPPFCSGRGVGGWVYAKLACSSAMVRSTLTPVGGVGKPARTKKKKKGGNTTAKRMQAVQQSLKRKKKKKINTSWDKKKILNTLS